MDGKTKAVVAHLTLIGWIIAFVVNSSEKDEIASFYIRQHLGLILTVTVYMVAAGATSFFFGMIPVLGIIVGLAIFALNLVVWIGSFVFWLISILGAFSGEEKPVPLLGKYYQDWFQSL